MKARLDLAKQKIFELAREIEELKKEKQADDIAS
jgi:hypothetical protein